MAVVKAGLPTGGYVGRFGNAVFYEAEGRILMREVGEVVNPRTPEQQAGRRTFGGVAKGWRELSDAAYAAWEAFGAQGGGGGYRAYMSLTRKWLRVWPEGEPPTMPPSGPFFGDNVSLRVEGGGARAEAALVVVASQANAEGVVTEILVQAVAGVRRKPRARDWKTAGFVAFAPGSLEAEFPLGKGCWAVSYRFVNARTGQSTASASLGAATVG